MDFASAVSVSDEVAEEDKLSEPVTPSNVSVADLESVEDGVDEMLTVGSLVGLEELL